MPTKLELEAKFNSVKKIKQIARAMELIATSRLRKVRDKALNSRPYSEKINEILISLSKRASEIHHPLLERKETFKYFVIICFTSDRGLCGGFNNTVTLECEEFIHTKRDKKAKLIVIGQKGIRYFKQRNYNIVASFQGLENKQEIAIAQDIRKKITELYQDKEVGEIYIIFNRFKQQLLGKVTLKKILPCEVRPESKKDSSIMVEHIYEPSPKELLDELIPQYITNQIYQAALESRAREEMARMLAMKQATDNADDMISQLQLQYHKLRQALITKEIIEVVGAS